MDGSRFCLLLAVVLGDDLRRWVMQTHFLPRKLKGYKHKIIAQWATGPATKLIIFVHGFAGSSSGTWIKFPSLLPGHPSMNAVDLMSYGYDGKFTQANSSALAFFDFLQTFLKSPAQLMNRTNSLRVSDRVPFAYEKIVIVAHSLGAVISRLALLQAHQRRARGKEFPWLEKVELVLFAPAHLGAYSAEIVHSFLTSQGWWLGNLISHGALSKSPLIIDLVSTSKVITDLEKDTKTALASTGTHGLGHLAAKRVVWALYDKVVKNGQFCDDEPADAPPLNANHVEVCKPRRADDEIISVILGTT